MTDNKQNIPQLRFPEFSGEWEEKKLGDVFKIGSGRDYKHLQSGNIPVYGTGGYMLSVNEYLYDGESVCIGRKGTIDKPVFLKGKFWTVDTLFYTHSFQSNIPSFIFLLFQNINWKLYNEASGVPSLSKATIEKIVKNFPKPNEQTKIAEFLMAVDSRVENLQEKKSLLEDYKKGVMQKIFSQQIRFTDESNNPYPDWEEKKLGEFNKFLRGRNLSKKDLDKNGKYSCIHYGELFTRYKENISLVGSKTNLEDGLLSNEGDILMPSSDVTPKGLAKASSLMIEGVILGGDINIIRPNKKLINSIFFSYLLNFSKGKIMRLVTGTTIKHIYNSDLKNIKINLPHPDEQQKIADFLSAIDVKIEAVTNEIEESKQYKKGLLQQMFV